MSGKAPPRAPRALLTSLAHANAASSSSTSSNTTPNTSTTARHPIPTGPRSLTNGGVPRPKSFLNGFSTPIPSLKGKEVDYNDTGPPRQDQNHLTTVNGDEPRPPSSKPPPLPPFSMQPPPPPPPLPPPPDLAPPPPPPPSISPQPKPPSDAPPVLPPPPPPSDSQPPPPPSDSQPPPPPSDSQPPPPPPPSDLRPVPLPTLPAKHVMPPIHFSKPLKPNLILHSPVGSPQPSVSPKPPEPAARPPPPQLSPPPAPPPIEKPSPPPQPPKSPSPPPVYSLSPPPPWPTNRSEFPQDDRTYKILFDASVEKDRDGRFRQLIEKIQQSDPNAEDRIKGKGKGKEVLYRYEGEIVEGEHMPPIRDPRKAPSMRRLQPLRPGRGEFHVIKYEYDQYSVGPPPPTAVLAVNISPLTSNQQIRRHFGVHGRIISFEPEIDKTTGGALGIVYIKFSTHEEAKLCVEKEHGGKSNGQGSTLSIQTIPGEELKVVLDDDAKSKLKAILRELDDRRRKEREAALNKKKEVEAEERRKKEEELAARKEAEEARRARASAQTDPRHRGILPPARHPLPAHPGAAASIVPESKPPPPALIRARNLHSASRYSSRPTLSLHDHSSSSTPVHTRGRPNDRYSGRSSYYPRSRYSPRRYSRSRSRSYSRSRSRSRSPSPISRKPGQSSRFLGRQSQREALDAELERNGNEYVTIEESGGGQLGTHVKEEDVRRFFEGFKVDKVLRDHLGWYVTFQTSDSARKAKTVLNTGARTLAHTSVTLNVHTPPSTWTPSMRTSGPSAREASRRWRDDDMVEEAERVIMKELRSLLEKDVMDRVIGVKLREMVADEEKARKARGVKVDGVEGDAAVEEKEKRGLKGLSFKKNKVTKPQSLPPAEKHLVQEVTLNPEVDEDNEDELDVAQRPKKRQKVVIEDAVLPESEALVVEEAEEVPALSPHDNVTKRKEPPTADSEDGRPVKKSKAVTKKKAEKEEVVEERAPLPDVVIPGDADFEILVIAEVRLSVDRESSAFATPEPASVSPDPIVDGLFEDDEDMYFAKLALARDSDGKFDIPLPRVVEGGSDPGAPPPFRVHTTGSARTEGYYKITHAEKSAYVAQYTAQAKATSKDSVPEPAVPAPAPVVTSSRSNRANARRRAQGIEEINQMQRAMQLSLGETPATDQVKFNQLQTRKKHLRFARSPIHDWGLYAMERIARGEMVIEYVGEVIRAAVADKREKAYERQGIGSSYLFRIDEDLVVDATKKGNLGRLINHSCDPNCTAKIITISGVKKIVIYAKQEIELGDEITYDYHFPIEQDKIPCLCGSAKCRGYLN